jgi:hypothetical protein
MSLAPLIFRSAIRAKNPGLTFAARRPAAFLGFDEKGARGGGFLTNFRITYDWFSSALLLDSS